MIAICLVCAGMAVPVHAQEDTSQNTTTFDVKIVQTNDMHARVEEDERNGVIGMDRLSGIIRSFTADADASLVLDAGDTFHGQPIATLVKGESVAKLMKACGYDAMTPGNHDWSYGKDRLKELGMIAGVKMLAGNVADENGNLFFDEESYVKEVTKDGKTLKIGVFGVIDPNMYEKTTPSNVAGLTFTDSVSYAKQEAAELKQEGCDLVIALSHTYDPQGLASQVNGVDLWLCGHEHTVVNAAVTTPDGSTAYVSESGYYLNQAALINLECTVDEQDQVNISYQKQSVDYAQSLNYEKDSDVTAVLDTIKQENEAVLGREVGTSPEELDGVWEHLRINQTNLGNVVTDAYLKVTGADIAFENAGGIRASVKAGKVTYGDIINVSPYGNYIVTKKLTGKEIKEMLETSASIQEKSIAANESGDWDAWPQDSGSYLQVGGITVEYDPSQAEGSKILSVKVTGQALDEEKEYTVAVNNYLAGSDTYPQLAGKEETGEFQACDEALIAFFEQGENVVKMSADEKRMIRTTKEEPGKEDPKKENPKKEDSGKENPAKEDLENRQPKNTDPKKEKQEKAASQGAKSPKTADESDVVAWSLLLLLGGTSVMLTARRLKKERKVL